MAQNLSKASGDGSEVLWQGTSVGGPEADVSVDGGGFLGTFDKSDDEPEEVVAVVIDSPNEVAEGGAATYGPTFAMAKIQGYFEYLQAKLRDLMVQIHDR